jgi:hypothetical protein
MDLLTPIESVFPDDLHRAIHAEDPIPMTTK